MVFQTETTATPTGSPIDFNHADFSAASYLNEENIFTRNANPLNQLPVVLDPIPSLSVLHFEADSNTLIHKVGTHVPQAAP